MTASSPLALPDSDDSWSDWLAERCENRLADARRGVDELKAAGSGTLPAIEVLTRWNDVSIALSDVFGATGLLMQVHPDEQLRSQAQEASQDGHKVATDMSLDRELYDVLAAVDPTGLDTDSSRLLRLALRDFTRSGVDKDDETRQRLRDLAEQETVLGQEFSRNIRDDVREIAIRTEQLDGLPEDYIAAHPAGEDGLHHVNTDYPDTIPFLTFANDAAARRELHIAFLNRGWPANDELLQQLLPLRTEHARLLGYDDWASYDAEVKMIGSGPAIGEFIDRIVAESEQPGLRDRAVLLDRLREDRPDATEITRCDSTHYAEVIRRERFDVDAQQVRQYFDFTRVRAGLLDVTGRLFGLRYTDVPDAARWHPDVTVHDVWLGDEQLGRIYLDLHPREGKYKHAAQFDLVRGVGGVRLPEGALVCNFSKGLMEHSDVVTLFHEFGHLIHHVLAGRQTWIRFSGVATEWDFVEAPSQMLEEWAWDADVLATFARNEEGEAIPADLVARMRTAQEFGKGYQARGQMFYAATSYTLHLADRVDLGDITGLVRELQSRYDLFSFVEGTHFHTSFGHLEGYTSAYYTYMWSLVIAKDLFSAFDASDLFAAETAHRYRDLVLARGGSADAADLVADFLGRPYNADAFGAWLNAPV